MSKIYCRELLILLLMFKNAVAAVPEYSQVSPESVSPVETHCSLSVSTPVVDYGTRSRWQMDNIGTEKVSPGTRTLALNVVCPYSRTMRLQLRGEGHTQGGFRYGERGYTQFRLLDAQLDGQAVELRTVDPDGVITGTARRTLSIKAGQWMETTRQGKILTAQLEIQAVLPVDDARVSSLQRNETKVTLTLDD